MEQDQHPAVHETKTVPCYGVEILRYGKWILTANGILFEGPQAGESNYFLESACCGDMVFMKEVLKKLLEAPWPEELDYHDFIRVWFHTLSLVKANPQQGQVLLSEMLSDFQGALEKKFSSQLIN